MAEIDRMIENCTKWKEFHKAQRNKGVEGAAIEALACDIRIRALRDAKIAIIRERSG